MTSPSPAPTANGPQTVEDREKERAAMYGTYVAVGPIDIEGGRAFNAGDAVPNDHVDRGVVAPHQVAKRDTKAGRAALGIDENQKA